MLFGYDMFFTELNYGSEKGIELKVIGSEFTYVDLLRISKNNPFYVKSITVKKITHNDCKTVQYNSADVDAYVNKNNQHISAHPWFFEQNINKVQKRKTHDHVNGGSAYEIEMLPNETIEIELVTVPMNAIGFWSWLNTAGKKTRSSTYTVMILIGIMLGVVLYQPMEIGVKIGFSSFYALVIAMLWLRAYITFKRNLVYLNKK